MNQHEQAYVHGFTTKLAQHGVSPAAFVRAAYESGNPGLVKVAGAISRAIFDESGNLTRGAIDFAAAPAVATALGAGLWAAANRPANSSAQNVGITQASILGGAAGYLGGGVGGWALGADHLRNPKARAAATLLGSVGGGLLGAGTGAYAADSYINDNHGLVGKMRNRFGI